MAKALSFWSVITIKRTVYSLEKQNLLYVGNYNKAKFDKTKCINYETLEGMRRPSYQNDTTSVSKDTMERIKMIRPIPETTQRLQQRLLTIIYCLLRRLHILTKT